MESTLLFYVPIFHFNNIASTYVDLLNKTTTKNDNNEAKLDSSGRGHDFWKKKKFWGWTSLLEGKKRGKEKRKKEKDEENKVK